MYCILRDHLNILCHISVLVMRIGVKMHKMENTNRTVQEFQINFFSCLDVWGSLLEQWMDGQMDAIPST